MKFIKNVQKFDLKNLINYFIIFFSIYYFMLKYNNKIITIKIG